MVVTTQSYIEKATKVHEGKYSYESLVYVGCQKPVEITCKTHGNFLQDANSHLCGKGCTECWNDRKHLAKRLTTEEFISRSLKTHGERYDYSQVVYETSLQKVLIRCTDHGTFSITPANHIAGQGCKQCAIERQAASQTSNTESFIEKAVKLHGDKYNYSKVEYKNNYTNVTITCPKHEDFEQTPSNHLYGRGCPYCRRDAHRGATFYILQYKNITKVGVTKRDIKLRVRNIAISSKRDFTVFDSFYFDDGSVPWKIERHVLKWLKAQYSNVSETFDGSTECFLDVNMENLLAFVIPLVSQHTTATIAA